MKTFMDLELQYLWDTYSQSPIPTIVISKEGKIIEYNEATAQLTGYSHEELPDIETWMQKLYPYEEYRNQDIEISRKSQQREIDVKRDQFIIMRKDGKKSHIGFFVYDILHEAKPTNLQVIRGVDINEKKAGGGETEKKNYRAEFFNKQQP